MDGANTKKTPPTFKKCDTWGDPTHNHPNLVEINLPTVPKVVKAVKEVMYLVK